MPRGFTLVELVMVLLIAGFVLALSLRPLRGTIDYVAADAAAREVTVLIATARHTAIAWGCRTRLRVAADSLVIDTLGALDWGVLRSWPGPASRSVGVTTSNAVITFAPTGVAWGASNTTITLTRGSRVETVIVSRVGRVRRG